ncbi:ABC transporter ATP-binding domain-containing protein (plasmid) [Rhizobium etli]|uniref:ABC transporter ATP-binding domain-containing protein n=1 Tax=Rhizobium etli TaxID=29449 RepID=A0AAN1BKT7_RHIET|nr:ABC transporter ATP-binding domain-containing protein [Rhizobium etli]
MTAARFNDHPLLRWNMRIELAKLHRQMKATMIYVTHEQVEAMTLADRIVVLDAGNISQTGGRWSFITSPPICSSPALAAIGR